ncbi:MAG TPA: branched-chain amino acid ABC transporter permease [Acidimicrobiales bacterium]|nr:branched-chain amino acid ABC transporter permease [Acidimicrobiales bacterium]
MELFFNQVINGIQQGAIYAALALALVLIFRSTSLLNFAQGEMAMFSTFIAWILADNGFPVVFAILAAMAVSVVGGAIIERTLIRPVGSDNVLAIVIVTIGIFIATNALAGWIYGTDGRVFPRIFPNESLVTFGDVTVTKETTGIVAILLVVVGLLYLLFQHTKVGLAMRAVASNAESAQLVGIRVGRILMLGWGLAAALGALAGALAAPQLNLSLNLMQGLLIYAFAAATLGGFDSPLGAVVGGLIVGVTQTLAGQYIDFFNGFELGSAFLLILIVLLVRPQGLFGKAVVTRV